MTNPESTDGFPATNPAPGAVEHLKTVYAPRCRAMIEAVPLPMLGATLMKVNVARRRIRR